MKLVVKMQDSVDRTDFELEVDEPQLAVMLEDEEGRLIAGFNVDPDEFVVTIGFWPDGENWVGIKQLQFQPAAWAQVG